MRATKRLDVPFWTTVSRRQSLVILAATGLGLVARPSPGKETDVSLASSPIAGRMQRVQVVVEVTGDLKLNPDGREVRRLPMDVKAELLYLERFLRTSSDSTPIRRYEKAQATMRMKEAQLTQSLRDDRRLIVALDGEQPLLVAAAGPLTREELDLIDVPCSSQAIDAVLPGKSKAVGDQWKLADDAVARLLNLDAVGEQSVEVKLAKLEDQTAILDLRGKVTGAVGGVSTEMDLQGKANFDTRRQIITWLAIQCREKRAIGHAQPGYDATVRIRMQLDPCQIPPELSDTALAGVPTTAKAGKSLLEFKAERAGVEFLHDRRWRIMSDRLDTVVMRMIDRGDLIAQCNVTRLAPLAKGQALSLAAFQQEVEKTLEKSQGQIIDASQSESGAGLRVLRVTVSGTASELPIQWIYYHVSDDQGHRASLVFTMEASLVERFAQSDREMIESLRLGPSPLDETGDPTPAKDSKSASRPERSTNSK